MRLLAPLLFLGLALAGCSAETAPVSSDPIPPARRVGGLADVQTALEPRAEERGVLLALWASW